MGGGPDESKGRPPRDDVPPHGQPRAALGHGVGGGDGDGSAMVRCAASGQ